MTAIIASMLTAAFACAINIYASSVQRREQDDAPYRLYWVARRLVGGFAAVYTLSLAWLLFGDIDQGEWSRRMIWLTPLAFLTAWSIEPAGYLARRSARRRALGS